MAENQEQAKPKEKEIPVFTVLKNNCILKNIFLLDNPPSVSSSDNFDQEFEIEEVLLVGRHPDCNIKLEHPSISRFHLRIHSKPSSRSLFVTDLSSVHGTWISGKRIEPGVRMKLNEGDTLHLGASSRLYRLNWVPLSRAYDIEDPFVPQLDSSDGVDEGTEATIDQNEDNMESLEEQLFSDEDLSLCAQKMSQTASPMSEDLCRPFTEVENSRSAEICNKQNELSSSQVCQLDASVTVHEETEGAIDQDLDSLSHRNDQGPGVSDNMEGLERLFSDEDLLSSMQNMSSITLDVYHPSSDTYETENKCSPEVCNKENELFSCQLSRLDASVTVVEETEEATEQNGDSLSGRNDNSQNMSDNMEGLERLFAGGDLVLSMQKMSPIAPSTPEDFYHPSSEKNEVENNHSPEVCYKEYSRMNSEKKSGPSIWSRRGKPESVKIETNPSTGKCKMIYMSPQVKSLLGENRVNQSMLKDQYASPDNDEEIFTPDKENTSPNSYLVRSLKCKFEETLICDQISRTPLYSADRDEEIFTPDKENVTPNSCLLKSMKNSRKFGEVKHPNSYRPSPLKTASGIKVLQERKSTHSGLENQGSSKKQPPVLKARTDREPFRSLPVNSMSDNKANSSIPSVHGGTVSGSRSIKYPESEGANQSHNNTVKPSNNRWTIVADTTCLLNRKSRKELQLLRGLRGTILVIPRVVIRELDCMLRRASFLSRLTEASAALQWIEECMATTKWWIHVQSSAEEDRLVPPTPPASSPHWFSEEKGAFSVGSIPFSPFTLQEIVTPTAADHILESALLFRRTMNGQLVLLSDDVTLKIKAMAEGVICETAGEFRGSLVNPFSSRFLYSNSCPIGPTWSCADDTVIKEKYYPSPTKTTSRSGEGAKGLKLILLHNSNFRPRTPVG